VQLVWRVPQSVGSLTNANSYLELSQPPRVRVQREDCPLVASASSRFELNAAEATRLTATVHDPDAKRDMLALAEIYRQAAARARMRAKAKVKGPRSMHGRRFRLPRHILSSLPGSPRSMSASEEAQASDQLEAD
jgi:hypothetical protein